MANEVTHMFRSRFMPCNECGASLDRNGTSEHDCVPERRSDYEMFGLREEIAQLDPQLRLYLSSALGRFESWLAARHIRS